ncbi:hypothetical protein GBAR_LOCUS1549, partial [Geodia barretti]
MFLEEFRLFGGRVHEITKPAVGVFLKEAEFILCVVAHHFHVPRRAPDDIDVDFVNPVYLLRDLLCTV